MLDDWGSEKRPIDIKTCTVPFGALAQGKDHSMCREPLTSSVISRFDVALTV